MKYILHILFVLAWLKADAQFLNTKYINSVYGLTGDETYIVEVFDNKIWVKTEGSYICCHNGFKSECWSKEEIGVDISNCGLVSSHGLLHLKSASDYLVFNGNKWLVVPPLNGDKHLSLGTLFYDSIGTLRTYFWTGLEFERLEIDKEWLTKYTKDIESGKIGMLFNGLIISKETNVVLWAKNQDLIGKKYISNSVCKGKEGELYFINDNSSRPKPQQILEIPKEIGDKVFYVINGIKKIVVFEDDQYVIYNINTGRVEGKIKENGLHNYRQTAHAYLNPSHKGIVKYYKGINFYRAGVDGMVGANHNIGEDNDGMIWFGGYKTGLSYYDGLRISKYPMFGDRTDNLMTGRLTHGEELLLSVEDYGSILSIKEGKVIPKKLKWDSKKEYTFYDMKLLEDDVIAFGTFRMGLGLVHKSRLFIDPIETISDEQGVNLDYIFCIAEDKNQRIWMASQSEGIAIYDRNSRLGNSFLIEDDKSNRFGVTSLYYSATNNLWVGTKNGLYVLKDAHLFDFQNKDVYMHLQKIKLTPFEGNTTALDYINGHLVVSGEREIYFIDLKSFEANPSDFTAFTYSYKHDLEGRSSEENGGLIDSKGHLWLATQEGYLEWDMDQVVFDSTLVDIYLDKIIIADSTYTVEDAKIELPPDNRNFSYSYNVNNNPSLRNNFYIYSSIIKANGDTLFRELYDPLATNNRFFLEPGKYRLVAHTYKNNRLVDKDVYDVYANQYLSEHPLYWPSIVSFGMLGLFYVYKTKQEKKKSLLVKDLELAEINQQKNEAQLQAVISSFNPHFVNNSLHWAQSRYNEDATMVKVIGRLSENIEYIFLKTKNGEAAHSLKEELRLVENYVLIQKARFKDTFDYFPPSTEAISNFEVFKLPIMQLQIHVENAIEHGLRNRVASTFVRIEIQEDPDFVTFIISDDGLGRRGAQAIQSRGTQSGVDMLKTIHEIFNKSNKHKITQWYEDDYLENHGTRLFIKIPKDYHYAI